MPRLDLITTRSSDLSPAQLWPVLADLDGYAAHVDGLTSTVVTAGAASDAQRVCTATNGGSWSERVVSWDEGRGYTIEVDTGTYPTPLKQLFRTFRGTWLVEPSGSGSTITLRFEADVRGGPLGKLLIGPMRRKSVADLEATFDSYEAAARSA